MPSGLRAFCLTLAGASLLTVSAWAGDQDQETGETEAEHPALADYEATGETTGCIPFRDLRRNPRHVLSDRAILFIADRNKAYLNRLDEACQHLKHYGQFQINSSGMQLCEEDSITVLRRQAGPGQHCGLGKFEILQQKD